MIALREFARANEQILWEGKPDKKTTVMEAVFNPMLVFSTIWGIVDIGILGAAFAYDAGDALYILIPFILLHMTPVWIYLIGVFTVLLRWRNTNFMVTTGGLYVSGGLLTFNYEMKPWVDISHITVHQGVFDRIFKVGDVVFTCSHTHVASSHSVHSEGLKIHNIPDFKEVFNLVNNLQTDMYSDAMYPNAMRPDSNPGYNTQYRR